MVNNMTMPSENEVEDFQSIYSGIVKSFAIILCGYITAKLKIVSQNESKGLSTFVGSYCLPALIFTSLAELDLVSVNWTFLLAIFISKAVIFFIVMIVSLVVSHSPRLGKSGLYPILCTQSNDFAVGYPIVHSLYHSTHPDFPKYLYLIAPINLVMLNPFGFLLMEIEKERQNGGIHRRRKCKLAFQIVKGILLNPVVFMTLLGIAGNFIFKQTLPVLLKGILQILGSAFTGTALFLLGLKMVGNVRDYRGSGLVATGLLVVIKTFLLPVVTQEVVYLLNSGDSKNATQDLSNFGFLYGTFPTAPGAFVYSTQYDVGVDMAARTLVGSTFLSAPLMMISAKMITLAKLRPADYINDFHTFLFDVSIFGLVVVVWVILVYILLKKWRQFPHCMTLQLFIAQAIACIGAILSCTIDINHVMWKQHLQFIMTVFGVYSARTWTCVTAVTVMYLQCRSLCFTMRIRTLLIACGWGFPALAVGLLLFMVPESVQHPVFQYGQVEAIVSLVLLLLSFFVTFGCLVVQQRHYRKHCNRQDTQSIVNDNIDQEEPQDQQENSDNDIQEHSATDIEDLVPRQDQPSGSILVNDTCPPSFSCDAHQHKMCTRIIRENRLAGDLPHEVWNHQQRFRHMVLLVLLCFSMIVGIAISIWTLVLEEMSGIYAELVFLDTAFNFGQGFIAFLLFGLNRRIISMFRRQ